MLDGKAMRKCGGFAGDLPFVFDKVFTQEQQDYYERRKDEAIANIGKKKNDESLTKLRLLQGSIADIKFPIKNKAEFSKSIGINIRTLQRWQKDKAKWGITGTPLETTATQRQIYNNNGLETEQESGSSE